MESDILAIFLAIFASLLFVSYLLRPKNGTLRLPPGPRGLPIIGHLHLLGDLPHLSLQKLSQKYGPIMAIRLGLIPTVVITSPKYCELFLKTHDKIFASRPHTQAAKYLSYGQTGLVFAQYGSYWRNIRKLCTTELLTSSKVELFKCMREEEVTVFAESLRKAAESKCEIDISVKIESVIENIAYRMVFGSKDDIFKFKSGIQEAMRLAGLFNVADYIPFLPGLGRDMKFIHEALDDRMEKIIDEHLRDGKEIQGQQRDFIDVMLSLMETNDTRKLQLGRDNIKSIVFDIIAGTMDTSSTTIEWVIAELLRHPRVMKLVQNELETIVGLHRMVNEADLVKLDYLKMVIKESLRIHPVAPLLIPHESTEDVSINGYFIPKNSRILVNIWAIGRDPTVWSENAADFYPERFLSKNMDFKGHDFRFIPFGSGRRMCPGSQLGLAMVQLVVAQLVHCFNLELPDGISPGDLDVNEKFGLTLPRANHLRVTPMYRLHND